MLGRPRPSSERAYSLGEGALCLRSGMIVSRIAALPISAAHCPYCGAGLRGLTAAKWLRPLLRLLRAGRVGG